MAFVTPSQQAFTAGLWGVSASGRADLQPYRQALSRCVNFIPRNVGSAQKRPGTKFVSEVKDSTKAVRLVPFIYDRTTSYVIELGDGHMRVYKNGALLPVIDGAAANFIATPWAEADLFEINWAQDADTLVVTHADYQPRLIQRTDDDDWAVSLLEFTYGPYLGRGESFPNVYPKESGGDYAAQMRLTSRIATGTNFRDDPTSMAINSDGDVFDATRDVGRFIVMSTGTDGAVEGEESYIFGTITAVGSATSATVLFTDGYQNYTTGGGTPGEYTHAWWLSAYWEDGPWAVWPSACTFYQERLILAGGAYSPDTAYASRLGSLDDFDLWAYNDKSPGWDTGSGNKTNEDQHIVLASSAIPIALSYPEVNLIQWIRSSRTALLIGTTRAVFVVEVSGNEGFAPDSNIQVRSTAATGSFLLPAININEKIAFISQDGDSIIRIGFSLEADSFVPSNLSRFSEDVLRPSAKDITASYAPDNVIWMATTDGRLVGCTIDDVQRVLAWHEHKIGGTGVTLDADGNPVAWGEVESVAAIPSSDQSYDELWMVVRRTIDGVAVRYIEYMQRELRSEELVTDQYYVDCGGTSQNTAAPGTTTYTGLTHLVGETVDVLADGAAEAPKVVDASGEIELDDAAEDILAGLSYVSELHTMPIVVNDPQGGSMGKRHRVNEVYVRLRRSGGGAIAAGHPDELSYRTIAYRQTLDPLGAAPPLYTGVLKGKNLAEVSMEPVLAVRHTSPVNFELLVIGGYMDASSR